MPITPPPGYITRAQAPKHYSRSKRALERDLDDAYKRNDADVLSHYLLVTKDGESRFATEITTDEVKELMAKGKVPTWCIEESYLQRLSHADSKTAASETASDSEPMPSTSTTRKQTLDSTRSRSEGTSNPASPDDVPLPDDVEYLKARLRILEREKQEQQRQHQETVAKLWNEIDVKNEQIQSWNEVTQGITKGLATGALTPVHNPDSPYLLARPSQQRTENSAAPKSSRKSTQAGGVDSAVEVTLAESYDQSPPSTTASKKRSKPQRASRASGPKAARPARTKKSQSPSAKSQSTKPSSGNARDGFFRRFRKTLW